MFGQDKLFFHDFIKRINILIFGDDFATWLHRLLSKHHENFRLINWIQTQQKVWNGKPIENIVEACIDWQSARFTKPDKPLDCFQTWKKYYRHPEAPEIEKLYIETLKSLQKIAEEKNLVEKWGVYWDWKDPDVQKINYAERLRILKHYYNF